MAERDYTLEMWRLLDTEAHLISSKQLQDRFVCVKSGAKKSLLNVFQDGNCPPKWAMVRDDRLKVWKDKDQPRVHVVPAFTPYNAPQAESLMKMHEKKFRDIFYEDEVVITMSTRYEHFLIPEDVSLYRTEIQMFHLLKE